MSELMTVVFVLVVILAVITLVGHGIWVVLSLVFGSRKGSKRKCPFCEHSISAAASWCDTCGKQLDTAVAEELCELAIVARQLRRLDAKGVVPTKAVEQLLGKLQRYRQQLLAMPTRDRMSAFLVEVADDQPVVEAEAPVPVIELQVASPPVKKPAEEPVAIPHMAPLPAEPQAVSPPPPPRRSFSEMLAGFMEEQNIRWGELIGGLLIVCSSVALVVSLWETLKLIPYIQFFIFVTISSAIFGVGLYAHHRWRLESTSRGMLIIATLLVPLNFVAMAGLSKDNWTAVTLLSECASLGIFTCLVGLSARILVPRGRALTVLAVVGNSAVVLFAARMISDVSPAWQLSAVGGVSAGLFAAAIATYLYRLGGVLRGRPRDVQLDMAQTSSLLTLLGVGAFAMLVTGGLLGVQTLKAGDRLAQLPRVLEPLSMMVALAGAVILAVGLAVYRGVRRDKALVSYQMAGTCVALSGMVVMLSALGMAWPHPGWLIAVGAINAAILAMAAFRWRLPILHAGAIACAAMAYLVVFHRVFGNLAAIDVAVPGAKLLQLTVSAQSGTALAGVFVVLAAVSEWLARRGLFRHGRVYMGGCAVVAVAGLMLVSVHGWRNGETDAVRAAILYSVYGAGSLALAGRWRRVELSYLAAMLLGAAPLWLLAWHPSTRQLGPFWATVMAGQSFVMAVAATVLHRFFHYPWNDPAVGLFRFLGGNVKADNHSPAILEPSAKTVQRRRPLAGLYQNPLAHVAELFAALGLVTAAATCWLNADSISANPAPAITTVLLTAVFMQMSWAYRSAWRSWIGSLVALCGLIHALNFNYFTLSDQLGWTWTVAPLAHATLVLLAVLGLDRLLLAQEEGRGEALRQAISRPLADSALFSSVLVLPMLIFARSAGTTWLSVCYPWLAIVWLLLAWRKRSAALFAAHQTALAAGALVATTIWLKHHGWVVGRRELPDAPNLLERLANVSHAVLDPRNLQVYGIALGLFAILWIMVRIADRVTGGRAAHLIDSRWTVDRIVRNTITIGQFAVPLACLAPTEILRELVGGGVVAPDALKAFGPEGWILLVVLVIMLAVALWERWRSAELLSLLALAATVPLLAGGRFCGDLAVASALRWGWAGMFVVCVTAIWHRRRLAAWCERARMKVAVGASAVALSQAVVLLSLAAPVIAVTLLAAVFQLGGIVAAGPLPGTEMARLNPTWSCLAPLVLVALGLVALAIRQRSAGYAFSAGLVVEMVVVLGYALTAGNRDANFFVTTVQLFTLTAALWVIVWVVARKWLDVWREGALPDTARTLMNIQIGMVLVGNILVLGWALLTLVFAPLPWQQWSIAAGLPPGWIALVLLPLAIALRSRLRPGHLGLLGMAAIGLLACTIRGLESWGLAVDPIWGYRTLMLGWAAYAWIIVLAAWRAATLRALPDVQGSPQPLFRMASVWVSIAAMAAVLLGLKAAMTEPGEQLWAATAIAVASGAGATMAVWRRREGWAFAAALGVNLAASLVVWHFEELRQQPFQDWWLRLVQANIIASAAVAFVWLAARKRLYELRSLTVGKSPLLGIQIALPVLGNLCLLVQPLLWLVNTPGWLPEWSAQFGAAAGWVALLLAGTAAAWYLRQTLPGNLLHVLGGLGLGAGVLAACAVAPWDLPSGTGTTWLAYHVLLAGWASNCAVLLGITLLGRNLRDRQAATSPTTIGLTPTALFPASCAQFWLALSGALTVGLVLLHGLNDPSQPWWSIRAVVVVSMVAAMMAVWFRQARWSYASGLLVNVAGTLIWWAWERHTVQSMVVLTALVEVNVLCLAINSAVWSVVGMFQADDRDAAVGNSRLQVFGNQAALCGTALACMVVGLGVTVDLIEIPHLAVTQLDMIALGAIATAVAMRLWDRSARLTLALLYSLALAAAGMSLWAGHLSLRLLCWAATGELAGFVFAMAITGWLLPTPRRLWAAMGIAAAPHAAEARGNRWFPLAQAILMLLGAALAAWVSIDFAFDGCQMASLPLVGRLTGLAAATLLLAAAIVMAAVSSASWRAAWRNAALATGLLACSCLGWSLLDADVPVAWLQRSAIGLVASAAVMLAAGAGLRMVLRGGNGWIDRGRRSMPALAGLTALMLGAVLLQEVHFFELPDGAPMVCWAIAAMIATLVGVIAQCIASAVIPELDPWRLSDRGRQIYVYAAEVLAALTGLHIYLTMHWLFHGFFLRYWMFVVMAVAFAGAAVSEWFHRRRLPVLSEPLERTCLFLPLLPAVGFWFAPRVETLWGLAGRTPSLWLLMGVLYGVMAISRRSLFCAALAALTMNLGLWVALDQSGVAFLEHPQIWLIPAALAGLVAELVNHDRLTKAQSTACRYFALSVIYVSSTADMVIAGVGEDWRLPLVLMVLAVSGVLAGMLLRIRSFLYLGVTFLLVDILSILWYAAVDLKQTWIWYACGIALGTVIFALFAVFEKRRNDVLSAVQRLKEWKG